MGRYQGEISNVGRLREKIPFNSPHHRDEGNGDGCHTISAVFLNCSAEISSLSRWINQDGMSIVKKGGDAVQDTGQVDRGEGADMDKLFRKLPERLDGPDCLASGARAPNLTTESLFRPNSRPIQLLPMGGCLTHTVERHCGFGRRGSNEGTELRSIRRASSNTSPACSQHGGWERPVPISDLK